jgi:hypothetical protein
MQLLAFCLAIPFLQESPPSPKDAEVLELVTRLEGKPVGQSRLSIGAREVKGESVSDVTNLSATVEFGDAGLITAYEKSVRAKSPDRLVVRIRMEANDRGYQFREDGVLGSRTRDIIGSRVHAIVDPAWPEALIPVLRKRAEGFVQVLVLPGGELRAAEIQPRPGNARYLDLPGGGFTLELSPSGDFARLLMPGVGGPEVAVKSMAAAGPQLPPSVIEDEVRFRSGDEEVAGTFARPKDSAGACPGVVLLADAGPSSRDGDLPGFRDGLLRELAWRLGEAGYASLRYDKRELSDPECRWRDLGADAAFAGRWLKSRDGIAPERLAIVGHGEGGLLACAVAADQPGLFRCVATLGAAARPVRPTLEVRLELRLRARGDPEESIQRAIDELREDLDALARIPAEVSAGPNRGVLRDLLDVDPVDLLDRVGTLPVLVLLGTRDPEVPPVHQSVLQTTMALRRVGNHRLVLLESADHVFKLASGERPADALRASGADASRPFHPDFLAGLKAFLDQSCKPGTPGR